ncbi:hypothetical protein TSH100_03955 [Azospirillum sp. TSH100]|uniref:hypothetical protein n=1 Tax=Azospirillum sp. TSH100 TaxID=652764 RepID=UPI000D6100D0|nr:hypothetical protein [Azospirillum sp. TSH100]PWC89800.1 hypothetical protein TSH100_03955 [Azospirillum sp. TSH100]QCG92339.1 hypothetical protein E6C72_31535 [Azospirillum sp. TSH100]
MIRYKEPVSGLIQCALGEFPSLSVKVMLVAGMADQEGAWGQTWWPDASGELHPDWEAGIDALIQIDGGAPYYAIPDILAHELAHAVAGPDGGHGDVFADAYLRIHKAFCRAAGQEPTPEQLAELHELIDCARTGRPFGTEPASDLVGELNTAIDFAINHPDGDAGGIAFLRQWTFGDQEAISAIENRGVRNA